jgi:hypothetical protein
LLELPGERGLWRLVTRQLSRTAQGRAYVQCELRGLTDAAAGIKRDVRFRSDELVETAALDSPAPRFATPEPSPPEPKRAALPRTARPRKAATPAPGPRRPRGRG